MTFALLTELAINKLKQSEEQADDFAYLLQYEIKSSKEPYTFKSLIEQVGWTEFCSNNIFTLYDTEISNAAEAIINYLTCFVAIDIFIEHLKNVANSKVEYSDFIFTDNQLIPTVFLSGGHNIEFKLWINNTDHLESPLDIGVSIYYDTEPGLTHAVKDLTLQEVYRLVE